MSQTQTAATKRKWPLQTSANQRELGRREWHMINPVRFPVLYLKSQSGLIALINKPAKTHQTSQVRLCHKRKKRKNCSVQQPHAPKMMTTPRTHGVHLFLATILIALFALASSASSTSAGLSERELQTQFNSWMRNHGRSYNADEFLPRYQAWRSNMDFIEEFNRQGNRTFAVAMNQFGDLTPEEFGRLHKGHLSNPAEVKRRLDQESLQRQDQICGSTPAASWDWVTQGKKACWGDPSVSGMCAVWNVSSHTVPTQVQ